MCSMNKLFLTAIAAGFIASAAFAQDDIANMPAPGQPLHPQAQHEGMHRWKPDMAKMTPEQREHMKARMEKRHEMMEKMTPEQRAKFKEHREERREKFEKMTPEQREHAKARMEKRHAEWEKMTPAQREAAKAKFQQRRAEHKMGDKPAMAPVAAPGN